MTLDLLQKCLLQEVGNRQRRGVQAPGEAPGDSPLATGDRLYN